MKSPIIENGYMIASIDMFKLDIFVAYGRMTKEQLLKMMRKCKLKTKFIEEFEKTVDADWQDGFFWQCPVTRCGMISIQRNVLDWSFYHTLLHELNHVVHFMIEKDRACHAAYEAKAYAQEALFRQIQHHCCEEVRKQKKGTKNGTVRSVRKCTKNSRSRRVTGRVDRRISVPRATRAPKRGTYRAASKNAGSKDRSRARKKKAVRVEAAA